MAKVKELKRHIAERRLSVAQISKALGISCSTFYRMLEADGEKFTIDQVKKLEQVLSLKQSETLDIFF